MEDAVSLQDVQNLLEHLHDPLELASQPLAQELVSGPPSMDPLVRGQSLKQFLMELIETLRPVVELPPSDVEWRPYLVLHERYVRRRPLRSLEERLALSDRQVRRVHHEALTALARLLSFRLASPSSAAGQGASTRLAAVERLSPKPRTFELAAVLERVAGLLTESTGALIACDVEHESLAAHTDPGILHQLLVRLLQLLIARRTLDPDLPEPQAVTLSAYAEGGGQVMIDITAQVAAIEPDDEEYALCAALARAIGADLSQEASASAARSIYLLLPRPAPARRVLIIDDDPPAIELFTSYLQGLDYQVIGETSAEQALQRAAEIRPAAIVLDVMMPGMDGWELLQRLRHTPQINDVPIIACSVLDDAGLAFSIGAARYLKKPVLRQHLVTALAELLQPQAGPA